MSTTETEYQLGAPAQDGLTKDPAGAAVGTSGVTGKRGHKCCGGCCDVRRAVVVVNLVTATLTVLGLVGTLSLRKMDSGELYPDDDVKEAAFQEIQNAPLGVMIAHVVVKLLFCAFGILGALRFNVYMVGAAAASFFFDMVLGFIGLNSTVVITQALFLYPHIFLIKEIREGIMSKENYPFEEQSCCCV